MKRVLIVNYEFPPIGGGGGVSALVLAKGFIEQGYEVDYLTSWYTGLKKFEVVEGINVHRIKVLGRTGLQTATMISLLTYPIAGLIPGIRLCLTRKYSFINTHFVVPSGPLGFALALLFRLPHLLSIHGGDIYDPSKKASPHRHWYFRAAVRYLMNAADEVIAQSSNTKENAVRLYGIARPIRIIPLAYEPFPFTPASRSELGLSEGKRYLIGIGRLVARKDFSTFIRALALLPEDVAGCLVGDGPERESLERLASELAVSGRLQFVGAVSEEKKFQYLSNADVYVLSSLHEGFGIVLQEAMQVGLPIVATDNGGQIDLVNDGVNGYLVPVGDPSALAEAVQKVLGGGVPKQAGGVGAFAPKTIAGQYLDFYTSAT
jgi:glycosyltransferase involved in cell wall biosynthesis